MKVRSRKFGQWQVTIDEKGRISIIGDFFSNYGLVYDHKVAEWLPYFDNGLADVGLWPCPQIIGMDNTYGLTKQVKRWIYGVIAKEYRTKGQINGPLHLYLSSVCLYCFVLRLTWFI